MKKLLIGTACVLASGSLLAGALPAHEPMPVGPHGWYAGLGINHGELTSETQNAYNATVAGNNKLEESHPGVNVFVGYRLSQYWANELEFSDVGNRQWKVNAGAGNNHRKQSTHDTWLVQYDALGFIPLYEVLNGLEFFGKAGVDKYYTRGFNADATATATYDKNAKLSTFAWNWGAGLQYNWRMLGARISYTNYENTFRAVDQGFDPSNLVALDVMYYFG